MSKYTLGAMIATIIACAVLHAETGLGRHKRAYAVPLPGKVVIDGKLDDWDLSGQIEMFVMSETKEDVLERDTGARAACSLQYGDPEPLPAKET